ncbi:hypothetical protein XELAEV_18016863mg [Xenopus laevis]|uniref:Uncharacterized protein n=1 Tax=Xenopus laevis TaxID=8355 RepID=A0A974DAI3_XENLA|nr:hypothetical protein XELAEV_18016863mg [Xenopus laevis]
MKILGPWLDQRLDTIKETVTEVLQQVTNQNERITDAEQRIGTLEDELEKTQLVDTQRKITILADKVDDLETGATISV